MITPWMKAKSYRSRSRASQSNLRIQRALDFALAKSQSRLNKSSCSHPKGSQSRKRLEGRVGRNLLQLIISMIRKVWARKGMWTRLLQTMLPFLVRRCNIRAKQMTGRVWSEKTYMMLQPRLRIQWPNPKTKQSYNCSITCHLNLSNMATNFSKCSTQVMLPRARPRCSKP